MERFKMIASGYAFFIRNHKILLSKRKNTGYRDGWYSLPAGHIEKDEPITRGTMREISEETGIKLTMKNLKLVHVMHRKENDIRMDFFFLVTMWNKEPKNMEPDKCSELSWYPMNKIPTHTIPYIRAAIKNYQKKLYFSEFGWKK